MFKSIHPFPGIAHITDNMGVSFTLIEGSDRALLFDTGYGMEDVMSYIRTQTEKPVKLILSHGHHDHVLGTRWFPVSFLCEQDMAEFFERSGSIQRNIVKKQAEAKKIKVAPDYVSAPIRIPEPIRFTEKTGPFESLKEKLGGLEVTIIRVPGHTPGSAMIVIPEYSLLLTGDNWNPCTWMWFPSSLSAVQWRENMFRFLSLLEEQHGQIPETILCSHQPSIRKGSELKAFLDSMTEVRMKKADPVDMGSSVSTYGIHKEPEDWTLIFDMDKI